MALIIRGRTCCAICGNVIRESDHVFGTAHFIGDNNSPLWRYSDAAMHRECFQSWELREKFVAEYNAKIGELTWGDGSYQEMKPDGSILNCRRDNEVYVR
jgi:hypothetical protein